MRGEQHRATGRGMGRDQRFEFAHAREVDRGEGLVEDPQRRGAQQQPRQRDAPLLTGGKSLRGRVQIAGQAGTGQGLLDGERPHPAPQRGVPAQALERRQRRIDRRLVTEVQRLAQVVVARPADVLAAPLTRPVQRCESPAMVRSIVVLPQPLGPATCMTSPARSSNCTSSNSRRSSRSQRSARTSSNGTEACCAMREFPGGCGAVRRLP